MKSSAGWHCITHIADLDDGTWLRAPLTPAGVVVVRGADGVVRAFHAVCPHRGAAFLDADEGAGPRFRCPYHGFEFELDGRACANTDDLSPVRVQVEHGFVFVNLDPDARPLDLGELPPWLERADFSRLKRARRVAYDVEARWTIVVENFQESLHFAEVHPALERITPSARAETWTPDGASLWLGGVMEIDDAFETVSVSGERHDRPFLVPEEDRRLVHDAMCFPNLLTSLQPDYLLTFTLFPISEHRTRVVASTYAHEDAGHLEDVFAFWDKVHAEDAEACARAERGLRSKPLEKLTKVEEGVTAFREKLPKPFVGIGGKPYLDLSELVDISDFSAIHREITRGLVDVETDYTGGSLKWMGVCAPWVIDDGYLDYMEIVRNLPQVELRELLAMGPAGVDLEDPRIGDETDHPLTRAQMKFLELRHGAYFPWKVCYHFLENDRWEDKHSGAGKTFTEEARRVFPKTVAFIESLPFTEIGRAVLFGVQPNDHAPSHRDSEPGKTLSIPQSISFQPATERRKRFFLTSPGGEEECDVEAPIYWFNDMDWHGVRPDPWFRYSIRVDGVFSPSFAARVRPRR